jgi:hypothetical protein
LLIPDFKGNVFSFLPLSISWFVIYSLYNFEVRSFYS